MPTPQPRATPGDAVPGVAEPGDAVPSGVAPGGVARRVRHRFGGVRGAARRRLGERGASSLELALLTPLLILVILLVIQFAMVFHARHVALAAAQSGARVAREQQSGDWKSESESKATSYLRQIGPELLTGAKAAADGDANQRWVVVTGTAVKVVPFMSFHVTQRSGGPIECYRPDVGTGTACGAP